MDVIITDPRLNTTRPPCSDLSHPKTTSEQSTGSQNESFGGIGLVQFQRKLMPCNEEAFISVALIVLCSDYLRDSTPHVLASYYQVSSLGSNDYRGLRQKVSRASASTVHLTLN
jgi:hypothetical protein